MKDKKRKVLELFPLAEYNLTSDSTFLDIGSGYGKPNFHVAMQVFPKVSFGIDLAPVRVNSALKMKE